MRNRASLSPPVRRSWQAMFPEPRQRWVDDARLRVLSGCGHWAMIEKTAEFLAVVRPSLPDFFNSCPSDCR